MIVSADDVKLRAVLSETGLPYKVGAKLFPVEQKIHAILCSAYSFKVGLVEATFPNHVLRKCAEEFQKLWVIRSQSPAGSQQTKVVFALTPAAIKTTLKTAMRKDRGIFDSKVNVVVLHDSWSRYFKVPEASQHVIDWSEAERLARRKHEQEKQRINDGKTFNAQKDNPWARKNLKNKNQ
jgi:hypothetical protein